MDKITSIYAWQDRRVRTGHETAEALAKCYNRDNWRLHPEAQRLVTEESLERLGFVGSIKKNTTTGNLLDGHLRVELAIVKNPETMLPVDYFELSEEEEKLALLLLDSTTELAEPDGGKIVALLEATKAFREGMDATSNMLAALKARSAEPPPPIEIDKNGKPNSRQLPIDMIYTLQGADCSCCLAVQSGLRYGIQSGSYRLCPYVGFLSGRHAVAFIDNDYFDYDHEKHLDVVRKFQPKYCTTRDVMTEDQCVTAGIEYMPLGAILEQAAELEKFAQNVIIIPKYDCLKDIPEQYILGYSIPTSHGGTPLQPELFRDRRVHLLGGSWKAQLAHMAILGDSVVSADNNQIQLIAGYGQYVDEEGQTHNLADQLPHVNNIRYTCLAISVGSIGTKLTELYKDN